MDNNTEQALNMLVSAARQAKLSYDEHAGLEQAVQVLLQALQPQEEKKTAKATVKDKV
ncbi:hypothetical protein H8E06_00955 [bacterium]|nr:hypothetical protein [bacterium]